MKKIATTGYLGNIGQRLLSLGVEPLLCDVRSEAEVENEITRCKPDVILHLAAQTSVDWCQDNYEEAIAANVFGTSVVCQVAEKIIGKGKVALISTDMVFDGNDGLYKEGDEQNPINDYGLSKLSAEGVAQIYDCKIIRISRCFDSKSKDFVSYLDRLAKGEEVQVPSHLIRTYCHFDFVTEQFFEYAKRFDEMPEILHLGGGYPISFYDLIIMIAKLYGYDANLIYPRGEKPGFVPRPFKGGLDTSLAKSLGFNIPSIEQSVERIRHEKP